MKWYGYVFIGLIVIACVFSPGRSEMPTANELVRTLKDLGMPPDDLQKWKTWMINKDEIAEKFGDGNTLRVGMIETDYGTPAFKVAETIVEAGESLNSFTWIVPPHGTHLEIRADLASKRDTASSFLRIRFNDDTGSNYGWQWDGGSGESQGSWGTKESTSIGLLEVIGDDAVEFSTSSVAVFINNYNNSDLHKGLVSLGGRPDGDAPTDQMVVIVFGWWRSKDPIRTITLFDLNGEDWVEGSVFSLYVMP